jgi:hypothetical protein
LFLQLEPPSIFFLSMKGVTLFVAALFLTVGIAESQRQKSFGSGRSQILLHSDAEFELLSYNVSARATSGATITFFWITGDPISGDLPYSGVDFALWRFYLDNEPVASIGPVQTSLAALVGFADPTAPWDNDYFGKNSLFGGWHFNLRVPFAKSVRVTLQMPPQFPVQRAFAMVRGVENLPVIVGGMQLPPTARLSVAVRQSVNLPVLAFHHLVSMPQNSSGLILGTGIQIESDDGGSLNSLEGCWHAFMPPSSPYPGLVLGTGAEDYPESAFYFNSGPFRGPTSGLTTFQQGNATAPSRISFYKLHHRDPVLFDDGILFAWRNGDVTDPSTGEKCTTIKGNLIGRPGVSNVTTIVYVYSW